MFWGYFCLCLPLSCLLWYKKQHNTLLLCILLHKILKLKSYWIILCLGFCLSFSPLVLPPLIQKNNTTVFSYESYFLKYWNWSLIESFVVLFWGYFPVFLSPYPVSFAIKNNIILFSYDYYLIKYWGRSLFESFVVFIMLKQRLSMLFLFLSLPFSCLLWLQKKHNTLLLRILLPIILKLISYCLSLCKTKEILNFWGYFYVFFFTFPVFSELKNHT